MLPICKLQPNWIPKNPKHMFQICQKLNRGLGPVYAVDIAIDLPQDSKNMYSIHYGYMPGSNNESVGQNGSFFHHHDPVLHGVEGVVGVGQMIPAIDPDIIANANVLIQDGIADLTALPYP